MQIIIFFVCNMSENGKEKHKQKSEKLETSSLNRTCLEH